MARIPELASLSVLLLVLTHLTDAIAVLEVKFSHDYLNLFHVVIEIRFGLKKTDC